MYLNWNLMSDPVLVDALWIWSDFKNNPAARMTTNRLAAYNYLTREVFGQSNDFGAEDPKVGDAMVMTTAEIQALADFQRVVWIDTGQPLRSRVAGWSQDYTDAGRALLDRRLKEVATEVGAAAGGAAPEIGDQAMPTVAQLRNRFKDRPKTVADYAARNAEDLNSIMDGAYPSEPPPGGRFDWTGGEVDMDIDELDWDPTNRALDLPPVER
jgi:hypothetical protein